MTEAYEPPAAKTFVFLDQTVVPCVERPGMRSVRNRFGLVFGNEKP